jgi:hypothetical protein
MRRRRRRRRRTRRRQHQYPSKRRLLLVSRQVTNPRPKNFTNTYIAVCETYPVRISP